MKSEETTPPRMPPRWLVHGAWRVHRALYKLSGDRFLWATSNKRGWVRCDSLRSVGSRDKNAA
jgi:F420H(2)-dependent quinone reductase